MSLDGLRNREYIEAVGRRKETSARVRIYGLEKGEKAFFLVNGKNVEQFFNDFDIDYMLYPFKVVDELAKWGISVQVRGGGKTGWRDAIRLGIARVLVKVNQEYKSDLRKEGLLTRDARVVERKKAGLKKARKAPRWSKR